MELQTQTSPTWTDAQPPAPPPEPQAAQAPSAAPLTGEHLDQLANAKPRAKKIRKACSVAAFNGYTLIAFAGISGLMAVVGMMFGELDAIGLGMGAGLGVLAWNELRGRAMLRRFEVNGCRVLGWNQLALMAVVIVYAAWMLGSSLWGPGPYDQAISQESLLAGPLGSINDLYKIISMAIYGGLIAGTLIFQGLNALYYFTRVPHVRAYVSETPPWVIELQRRGVA